MGRLRDLGVDVRLAKIPVTHFPRACACYREVVGLEEDFAVEEYGWAQDRAGSLPLCLYVPRSGGGEGVPGGETGVHLAISDLRAAYTGMKARGARFPCGLVESDDGGHFSLFEDLDGNVTKVVQK